MHISKVEIKNFRSIKDLQIDLLPGLNVLVGRNNTGKTNILNAIRHALGPSASRGDSLWLEEDDFYRKSDKDDPAKSMSITLTFSKLNQAQLGYFFEIIDFDLSDQANSKAYIRFEASIRDRKRAPIVKRTGGPLMIDSPEVPSKILESLPVTYLPALRDAEAALTPGYKSRLAKLLAEVLESGSSDNKSGITEIFQEANDKLESHNVVKEIQESLINTARGLAGTDYLDTKISVAETKLERILRSLHIQVPGNPISSLDANGLGYNNLLYMTVVIEHLKKCRNEESPLLLVEEPEAHLHPQLTTLLAEYLSNKPKEKQPQTIVTTHSPTLASSVPPSRVHVLFSSLLSSQITCNSINNAGLSDTEELDLQRMMDVTKSSLYFAKGLVLVEGISEALLFPVFAKRLGQDLSSKHISVLPICGVAFEVFDKLFREGALGIPVAMVSDADPVVKPGKTWEEDIPECSSTGFLLPDRMLNLKKSFKSHDNVKVFHSSVTLEFDLAEAAEDNALAIATAWEDCFKGHPQNLNIKKISNSSLSIRDKALIVWRGVCRSGTTGSKAELAHRLSKNLLKKDDKGDWETQFTVPDYIKNAIKYVIDTAK